MELQLASFKVCVACRGVRTLRVTVDRRMPLSSWNDEERMGDCLEGPEGRRLPYLRAAGVARKIPAGMFGPLLSEAALLRGVSWIQLTGVKCKRLDPEGCVMSPWDIPTRQWASQLGHSPKSCFKKMFRKPGLPRNIIRKDGSLS